MLAKILRNKAKFKYVLATTLIIISQSVFGLTCKSLIEQQLANQLDNSTLFDNPKAIVVVIICAQKPLPDSGAKKRFTILKRLARPYSGDQ